MPREKQKTGPKPKGASALTERQDVRFTVAEKERLREEAFVAGLSVGEYIRRRCFGKKIVADTDMAMIRELRRLGGLAKHIHNENRGIYSKQTADILVAAAAYITKLSAGDESE